MEHGKLEQCTSQILAIHVIDGSGENGLLHIDDMLA